MRVYQMHRPKTDRCRLQLKGREGGKRLLQTEAKCREEIMNRAQYE